MMWLVIDKLTRNVLGEFDNHEEADALRQEFIDFNARWPGLPDISEDIAVLECDA